MGFVTLLPSQHSRHLDLYSQRRAVYGENIELGAKSPWVTWLCDQMK